MGRIIAQTSITNRLDGDKSMHCGMLVDTGAGALILPQSWKGRLGEFLGSEPVLGCVILNRRRRRLTCWATDWFPFSTLT